MSLLFKIVQLCLKAAKVHLPSVRRGSWSDLRSPFTAFTADTDTNKHSHLCSAVSPSPSGGAVGKRSNYTPATDFLLGLEFCFSAGPASRDGRLCSKLRDGNQTGCLGACGSLNYFCLEPPACAERSSGVRANALVCRAFCHAHFSTLGSITNEMLSVGGPAGFQPAASLFITSPCSARVFFLLFFFFFILDPCSMEPQIKGADGLIFSLQAACRKPTLLIIH